MLLEQVLELEIDPVYPLSSHTFISLVGKAFIIAEEYNALKYKFI